jgi:hypothetical protein
MRKSLKRVLEQLRAATGGMLRKRTATRAGVQDPQQLQAVLLSARVRP